MSSICGVTGLPAFCWSF